MLVVGILSVITEDNEHKVQLVYENGTSQLFDPDYFQSHHLDIIMSTDKYLDTLQKLAQLGLALCPFMKNGADIKYNMPLQNVQTFNQFKLIVEFVGKAGLSDYINHCFFNEYKYGSTGTDILGKCFQLLVDEYIVKWDVSLEHVFELCIRKIIPKHKSLEWNNKTLYSSAHKVGSQYEYFRYRPALMLMFVTKCKHLFNYQVWDNLILGMYDMNTYDKDSIKYQQVVPYEWSKCNYKNLPPFSRDQLDLISNIDFSFTVDNAWIRSRLSNHPELGCYPRLLQAVNTDYALNFFYNHFITLVSRLPDCIVEHHVTPFIR